MGMRVRGKATARPDQIEDPAFTRENGWFGIEDRNSSPPAALSCTRHAKPTRWRNLLHKQAENGKNQAFPCGIPRVRHGNAAPVCGGAK